MSQDPSPRLSVPRFEVEVIRDMRIATAESGVTLSADVHLPAGAGPVIAEYEPDPTIGPQSGLWGVVGQMFGLPLEQHEDDSRSVSATTAPLERDVAIVGRPEVTVRLAPGTEAERLVVRLCDVDPEGRSTLVVSGVAVRSQHVVLDPTAYRILAGHRLRVALSDSEFPRLWPLQDAPTLQIAGIDLLAPTVSDTVGAPVQMPRQEEPDPATTAIAPWSKPTWRIARDPIHDGVEVTNGAISIAPTPGGEHLLEIRQEGRASVRRQAPRAATMTATQVQVAHLSTGEVIEVTVTTRLTGAAVWARGEVSIDGATTFSRTWDACFG